MSNTPNEPNESRARLAATHFEIAGELVAIAPYGSGHINDTYCAVFQMETERRRFILQRINRNVFKTPAALMENIQRVTAHLAAKVAGQPDSGRLVLALIPTRDNRPFHVDDDGNYWRAYRFIERARTFDTVETTEQAYQAARAFGQFQQMLVDLPMPRLHDTIPGFHDTPRRLAMFEQAVAADAAGRVALAGAEIEFALARRAVAGVLLEAGLPERVIHNDTKFNNVMFDDATGRGICVIDLDTVMPGLALYDFGDMVRTATSPAQEDELDLTRVTMQFSMFEALVRGYLSTAGGFLSKAEKQLMAIAGKVITYEQGLRFLTDYLAGDTYYKVARDGHNLDRCRTQFRLIESIEAQEAEMLRLIESIPD
jgi:Ser/Thr protein kinase RdoA (MazF antagonist)